jgi:hypothetical protein
LARIVDADRALGGLDADALRSFADRALSPYCDLQAGIAIAALSAKHDPSGTIAAALRAEPVTEVAYSVLLMCTRNVMGDREPRNLDYWTGLLADDGLLHAFSGHLGALRDGGQADLGIRIGGATVMYDGESFRAGAGRLSPDAAVLQLVGRVLSAPGTERTKVIAIRDLLPDRAPEFAPLVRRVVLDRDSRLGLRLIGAIALAKCDDPSGAAGLREMYASSDPDERLAAAQWLATLEPNLRLGTQWWRAEVDRRYRESDWRTLADVLSRLPAPIVHGLIEYYALLLRDPGARAVHHAAVIGLSRMAASIRQDPAFPSAERGKVASLLSGLALERPPTVSRDDVRESLWKSAAEVQAVAAPQRR